ncbi:MAG TPA: urea carboxylase, partial [Trueperaceae bacterium]|nr:urea carboxylase [Trueperaceae bacterium]
AVPGGGILSEANPLGAVQVTPSGKPLVLLHDRGTIGGYTKPAVVHPRDLPTAGQLRVGDLVRFVTA